LNEGQVPNPNVVRVSLGTGYHRVEGNRRASRNGRVKSGLPPKSEIPTVRFATFASPTTALTARTRGELVHMQVEQRAESREQRTWITQGGRRTDTSGTWSGCTARRTPRATLARRPSRCARGTPLGSSWRSGAACARSPACAARTSGSRPLRAVVSPQLPSV
jgi:hypothetical protein